MRLVWAGERVCPSYPWPAPDVERSVRDPVGFRVLDLPALVAMKLTSYRDIDRVHIGDLLSVGLVDRRVREELPPPLLNRLEQIDQRREE